MPTNIQAIQTFYTNDVVPRLNQSPAFLGNCKFLKHFNITTWGDSHLDNQTFLDPNTKCKWKFLVFGEVASAERGTKLGAQGNHYSASANEVCLFCSYSSSPNTTHNTQSVHPCQRWIACKRHHKTSRTNAHHERHRNPLRKPSCPLEGSRHCEHRKGQKNEQGT